VLIGIVALALVAASCGSDDDGGASDTTAAGGGTATTVAGKACSGDPIKIGQIVALTGQQTFPDLAAGARAAVEAENKECRLDRPLELVQCDGKNDPNAVAECGRKMVSEGIVALVTSVDPAIDSALSIIYAAKIPHVANSASSTLDSTSPLSYPINPAAMAQGYGVPSIGKALGRKSIVYVGPDVPGTEFLSGIVKRTAADFGLQFKEVVRIPVDATDFAPYAQQAIATGADVIQFAAGAAVEERFLNGLIDAGVDFEKTTVVVPLSTTTPALVKALGSDADGVYVQGSQWPLDDTSNEGIARMLKEMNDAGEKDLGVAGISGNTGVHVLADILADLPTIDSASIVAALNKGYTVDRPEFGVSVWGTPAFPNDPALSQLRVFTKEISISRIKGGKITPVVDDFVDVTTDYKINK